MCHHVVCRVGTNVLDKPDAFIFWVDYKATQKNVVHYPNRGPRSIVGIVTAYGLGGPGFKSR